MVIFFMGKNLNDHIVDIVKSEANNNPAPLLCRIDGVFDGYVSVVIVDYYSKNIVSRLSDVPCLRGDYGVDDLCVLIFIDGDGDKPLII